MTVIKFLFCTIKNKNIPRFEYIISLSLYLIVNKSENMCTFFYTKTVFPNRFDPADHLENF